MTATRKHLWRLTGLCAAGLLLLAGCENGGSSDGTRVVELDSVRIGNQIWSARNLNVDRFRNGDLIPEARTIGEWQKANQNRQPAWCYYDNNPAMGERYGRLYNWYAVDDARGLAPQGWQVPSYADWCVLENHLGDGVPGWGIPTPYDWNLHNRDRTDTPRAGPLLKSTHGWHHNGNGTNRTGFNALPGGWRSLANGRFQQQGSLGSWWSSTNVDARYRTKHAWTRRLSSTSNSLLLDVFGLPPYTGDGFSVRVMRYE